MPVESSVRRRLERALAKFRGEVAPEEAARVEAMFATAHEVGHAARQGQSHPDSRYADFVLAHSALGRGESPEGPADFCWIDDGGVVWGGRQYEQYDPGWVEAAVKYLEYSWRKARFAAQPQTIEMPSKVKLAVAGDWGTGFDYRDASYVAPSKKVGRQIEAQAADYTVHLGDTYYAGTREEVDGKLALWPAGKSGRFTIPGNHEMYCGDRYYYRILPRCFPLQSGTSFFALRNDDWLIVALDSAYHSTDFYMDGSLGESNAQTGWLVDTLSAAGGRTVIVMTHHQPVPLAGRFDEDEEKQEKQRVLYDQVRAACRSAGVEPAYWYFGHEHNAAVYEEAALEGCCGRLLGHASIPYGLAYSLDPTTNDRVAWAETRNAVDYRYPCRLLNGFMTLEIEGTALIETYWDENGDRRWSSAG